MKSVFSSYNVTLKQREYKRAQWKNEKTEQHRGRLVKVKDRSKKSSCSNSNNHLSQLIDQFHKSVSKGPLHVCSCCEQLWYKHSVSPAERLRSSNPSPAKYLQGIVSLGNTKWLCLTCNKYLKKIKSRHVRL